MPDYIYLLKNRLSIHQQNALSHIREAAREAGMTIFLVGGAVRDLTSGSPVLDLDVTWCLRVSHGSSPGFDRPGKTTGPVIDLLASACPGPIG